VNILAGKLVSLQIIKNIFKEAHETSLEIKKSESHREDFYFYFEIKQKTLDSKTFKRA
jgi:hypothetical protein